MVLLYITIEVLLAYLIGSIATAVWVGKYLYGIDVREHGSGNAGATNVIRVLGYKAGLPVMLFDVFKGWFAVQLVHILPHSSLSPEAVVYVMIALALSVFLGHVFPLFAGFKGGKGVGTLAGVAIALYPLALLIVLIVFIITLVLSTDVSLSSLIAGVAFPFAVILITGETHLGLVVLSIIVAFLIPLTHAKNIRRLLLREENKFLFKRNKEVEKPT